MQILNGDHLPVAFLRWNKQKLEGEICIGLVLMRKNINFRCLCIGALYRLCDLDQSQVTYTDTGENVFGIYPVLRRICGWPFAGGQARIHCLFEHRYECGLEHFGEVLQCRRCFTRMSELGIHCSHHEVIIAGIQHIIQAYKAQKEHLVTLLEGCLNGVKRVRRRLCIDVEIPEKSCKHQQNAKKYRTCDLYLQCTAHHHNPLPFSQHRIKRSPCR